MKIELYLQVNLRFIKKHQNNKISLQHNVL